MNTIKPSRNLRCPTERKNTVLFFHDMPERYEVSGTLFCHPVAVLSCNTLGEVTACILQLESFLNQGWFAAGFLSYEAGYAFEEKFFNPSVAFSFPLVWFGIYREPRSVTMRDFFEEDTALVEKAPYHVANQKADIDEHAYREAIAQIKEFIASGDIYQANYTFKYVFDFIGPPSMFFRDLFQKQSTAYSAFLNLQRYSILSLSPELFFTKQDREITVKPMKGTAPRGRTTEEDERYSQALLSSAKERAENLMIVDLLRNDLGKISDTGSVAVRKLFEIERYSTLFQMTSTIQSRLRSTASITEVFSSLFPSGSVTGAPKIRSMQIIRELEKKPRRVYTGCIGFFTPDKDALFNIAIRTILIDKEKGRGEMGVGSGIVSDSTAKSELAECHLKLHFLTKRPAEFQLIETLRWEPGLSYPLLPSHLQRLKNAAHHFHFRYSEPALKEALYKKETELRNTHRFWRVRLLLSKDGTISLTASPVEHVCFPQPVTLSQHCTDSSDEFLFHKTTNRALYVREYRRAAKQGFYDILFCNERGEITEGALSNIFIKDDKEGSQFITPPLSCGLLNGVYRTYLLQTKKISVVERIISKEDLYNAPEIYLSNAVRGLVRVFLSPASESCMSHSTSDQSDTPVGKSKNIKVP